MKELVLKTVKKDQIVDLTEGVAAQVPRVGEGAVVVMVAHTTCAVTTADLDPGTDLDFLNVLRHILPELSYRHPHDPEHAPDHILASLIGPSVAIPFRDGQLQLGTWQRIVLVELDGPRERNLYLSFLIERT